MSTARGGRGMQARGNGNVIRWQNRNPSESSSTFPLISNTSDGGPSLIQSNDGASQQRVVTQPKSGVIRYLFIYLFFH